MAEKFLKIASGQIEESVLPSGPTKEITQIGHGFSVGNVLRLSGATYVKSQADSEANAEVVGMVSAVADSDHFTLQLPGYISGLSGLTAGTIYFLSDVTAGALTATEPETTDHVSKPLLLADSATSGYFFNWRGAVIGDTDLFNAAYLPKTYLTGLEISHNTSDSDHDLDIAPGECLDSTNNYLMALSSLMTKRVDASWAAGTGNGGLFSGTVAGSTWYHIFLIRKDSDGTIDAGYDTSLTAPNRPAGYTYYRRIGFRVTDSSANWIGTIQRGDEVLYKSVVQELNNHTPASTNRQTEILNTPPGIPIQAIISATMTYVSTAAYLLFTDGSQPDTTPSGTAFDNWVASSIISAYVYKRIWTDTSSQIHWRVSGTGVAIFLFLHGWIDARGKN